jgi:multidrug efflux pump subunit AcrA (membrane-fusion protein)
MKYVISLVILALLGVGVWQALEWRNQPPAIAFAEATRTDIASVVSTNGKVEPSESAQARAETAGRVDKILVKLRQQVKAGDALVELDTAQLRHDLEAAEARIAAVQADLDLINSGGRPAERVALQTQIDQANVEL